MSGTTSLAASVGVEARTSATRSSSGESGSWPIAETTGVRSRVDRPDQRLVGERQQVLDGAAAAGDHDHVDVGVPVEAATASITSARRAALHGGGGDLELHRRPAAAGVLEDVALGGAAGRGDQPDAAGQERQRPLELGGEQALGGQQLAAALDAGQQLAEPDRADLAGVQRQRCRGWRRSDGWRARRCWRPRRRAGSAQSNERRASRSPRPRCRPPGRAGSGRRWPCPCRRLSWATWPSTQTPPSLSIHCAMALATARTGAGDSGVVSQGGHGREPRGGERRTWPPGGTRRLAPMSTDLGTPAVLSPDEADRAVLLAAPRGYCAGVDRAVITVEKALDLYGAPGLRPQADRAQQARRGRPRGPRRDLRRGARRGARGRHRGVLRARRLAGGPRAGRRARPQDHRRDLPAGDQGAPRGEALRRRRLRHPADRPRGPRGGRGHRR